MLCSRSVCPLNDTVLQLAAFVIVLCLKWTFWSHFSGDGKTNFQAVCTVQASWRGTPSLLDKLWHLVAHAVWLLTEFDIVGHLWCVAQKL